MDETGDRATHSEGELRERAASGVRWIAFGRLTAQVLGLGYTAILARALSPAHYGLFAMAMIIIQVARYVEGLRLEAALVQAREVNRNQLSSVYLSLVVLGVLFFVVFWFGAPLGRYVYGEAEVVPVIRGLAVLFVLSSLGSVPRAILNRRLDFRGIGVIQVVQVIPSGALGAVMAIRGYGVWSLVAYSVAQHAIEALALMVRARWVPSFRWKWRDIRGLLFFGRVATVNELLAYLQFNLPAALIGRFAGSAPLGFYQLANAVVSRPASVLQEVARRVSFPVFAASPRLTGNETSGFGTAVRASLAVSVPAAIGVAVYARELVALLYGSGWTAAIPLVRTLAGLTVLLPWMSLVSSFIQARGRPGVDARLRAVALAGILVTLPLALPAGVEAVCLAIVIWFTVFVILGQTWVNRHVDYSWWALIRVAYGPAASALAMALALIALTHFVPWPRTSARLLLGVVTGVVVYTGALWLLDRELLRQGLRLFRLRSDGDRHKEGGDA